MTRPLRTTGGNLVETTTLRTVYDVFASHFGSLRWLPEAFGTGQWPKISKGLSGQSSRHCDNAADIALPPSSDAARLSESAYWRFYTPSQALRLQSRYKTSYTVHS